MFEHVDLARPAEHPLVLLPKHIQQQINGLARNIEVYHYSQHQSVAFLTPIFETFEDT